MHNEDSPDNLLEEVSVRLGIPCRELGKVVHGDNLNRHCGLPPASSNLAQLMLLSEQI